MNAEVIPATSESTAVAVVEYKETEATLATLRQKHGNVVFDVASTKGDKEARAARLELVKLRTGLDKLRLKLNADDRKRIETRNSEAERITSEIVKLEEPIDKQIKADEERRENERLARIAAEQKRVADLQERVRELHGNPLLTPTSGSELIAGHIADLDAVVVDESFQEFREVAESTKQTGLTRLRSLHKAAVDHEAEQKCLAEEKAELERQKAEQARLAALRERVDHIRNYAVGARLLPLIRIEENLAAAQAFVVDESFAEMREEAECVRLDTIDALVTAQKERQEMFAESERRAAERKRLDDQKAEQDAAAKTLADERAELDRQQEALRLQQETLAKPSDPAEALPCEAIKPPLAIATEVIKAAPGEFDFQKPARPSDEVIIQTLMRAFSEDRATIVDWLCDLDLMALAEDEEPDFSEVALA